MNCWKCHEPVRGPVCVGCGGVQPPRRDVDYFELLGLQRSYWLEMPALEAAWRAVSRKIHPDRFAGKSAVERRMSLQWTATVNEARAVLRDPLRRARYLATGRADPDDKPLPMDPSFLEDIFDLQMEARMDPDGVRDRARTLRTELVDDLHALMAATTPPGAAVEQVLAKLKYVDNALVLVAG